VYSIKEIFYTLQGEGAHVGRPAVFIRFAGCNLWSGHEKHRPTAICRFCDTDFVGTDGENGGKYSAQELVAKVLSLWPAGKISPFVVLTGGEPGLQLDKELIDRMHQSSMYISIETNGTVDLPPGLDWVCVSPKSSAPLKILQGDELKLVYPQVDALPHLFEHLAFNRFSLQPMYGADTEANTKVALEYCKLHPQWHLSIQTHKILDIP
jgi:7-carboxy-7-deazaguanine synthase